MFRKFTSIENSYRKEHIKRIQLEGHWAGEYVVQEKVHGANMSFYTTDGISFIVCKRSGPVLADENFNNSGKILADNFSGLKMIWIKLKAEIPKLEQLTVFGEALGGSYPHPDVPRSPTAVRVQKGVSYAPGNLFYAFDVQVDGAYLGVDHANACFRAAGLLYAKTLFRGTPDEALAYPNDFNSTLPADLGLPDIGENVVEGTVIRPVEPKYLGNGSRVILKNKNAKWAEKKQRKSSGKSAEPLDPELQALINLALEYVNENRLENVLSKIGAVTIKDFGRVLGLFNKDVYDDFHKDNVERLTLVEKADLKRVNKGFGRIAADLVRVRLLQ
jgi:Rnl2 family RNA ligase